MARDTYRQWQLLRLIPQAPRRADAATLRDQLAEVIGTSVPRRMVQRDLHQIAAVYPLQKDDRSMPHGWYFPRGFGLIDVPNLDTASAVLLRIIDASVGRLLPRELRTLLEPSLAQAERVLSGAGVARASFASRVCIFPLGPPRLAPRIVPGVLEAIAEALYRGRRLAVRYAPRGADGPRTYTLNPLGLVSRGVTLTLVAKAEERPDVRQYLLHRFVEATVLDTPSVDPPDFDLGAYLARGDLGVRYSEEPLDLVLRFDRSLSPEFVETPLAEGQRVTSEADGWCRLEARVHDSFELRAWLLRFSPSVEVVAPASLRAVFVETARQMAARYGVAVEGGRPDAPAAGD